MTSPALEIGLLGSLRITHDGTELDLPDSRRARLLLAWLALNPGLHGRSRLAGTLRPDASESDARRTLRQATWHLTRALGPAAGALRALRLEVGLDVSQCRIDLTELRTWAAGGDLLAARTLRTQPLLPEHDADWLVDAREALRAELADLAAFHAAAAEAACKLDRAVDWARERAENEPFSEVAQRELMRLLALGGDRAAAIQVAARLRRRLADELGVVPSATTREAMDRLLVDDRLPLPQQHAPGPHSLAQIVA